MTPKVYRCSKVRWEASQGYYWLVLTLEGDGGVNAMFDAVGLNHLMSRCRPAGVVQPSDLVDKLFETQWDDRMLKAVRIHSAYGGNVAWLRVGIALTDSEQYKQIAGLLERED